MSRESDGTQTVERPPDSREFTPASETSPDENSVRQSDRSPDETGSASRSRSEFEIDENGELRLSFEYTTEFQVARVLGKLGGGLITLAILVSVVSLLLYFTGSITLSQLVALIGTPFPVGAGLIALANNPEYLPLA